MEYYLAGISIGLGLTLFIHTRNEKKKNDLRLQYTAEQKEKDGKEQKEKSTTKQSTNKCDLCNNPYYEDHIRKTNFK